MDPKVIVALDFSSQKEALSFTDRLDSSLCRLKVGKELFTLAGPSLVEALVRKGFSVFLDLKYHDIPNTVAAACRVAADLGVWMMNVHTLGGAKMMDAAAGALSTLSDRPLLIGVTILTSHSAEDIHQVGLQGGTHTNVVNLAKLAQQSGLDGVVCSSQEVSLLRDQLTGQFTCVTPGIRPSGSDLNDQKRVNTPGDAIRLGSNYLVIGRPITQAEEPMEVLSRINNEVEQALKSI